MAGLFSPTAKKPITVTALGDGNCAYNAFILSLCQRDVLAQLHSDSQALKDFVEKAGKALDVFAADDHLRWEAIKTKMLVLDRQELQKKLAPVMREISIDRLSQDESYPNREIEYLNAAFDVYLSNNANNQDDIFVRHFYIKDEFEKLARQGGSTSVEAKKEALLSWWLDAGHQKFLAELAKSGVWVGPTELASLADYFHVNLRMLRADGGEGASHCPYTDKTPTITIRHANGNHWNSEQEEVTVSASYSKEEAVRSTEASINEWNKLHEHARWEDLIKDIKSEGDGTISYTLPDGSRTINVTKATQETLDEAYAVYLQEKELKSFRSSCR